MKKIFIFYIYEINIIHKKCHKNNPEVVIYILLATEMGFDVSIQICYGVYFIPKNTKIKEQVGKILNLDSDNSENIEYDDLLGKLLEIPKYMKIFYSTYDSNIGTLIGIKIKETFNLMHGGYEYFQPINTCSIKKAIQTKYENIDNDLKKISTKLGIKCNPKIYIWTDCS